MAISPPYTICFHAKTKQQQEQDALIYQHYDRIISTLPKSAQTQMQLSLYKGFWLPNGGSFNLKVLQGTMAARDHFKSRPGDILLATLPKVGTTWLKALAYSTLNRRDRPNPRSLILSLNPHECVPFLEYQLYSNNRIPDLDVLPSPRLLATHMPCSLLPPSVLECEACRVVYLCRNPGDTLVSMWKFANNLIPEDLYEPESLEEFAKVFLSGVYTSGPFWDNVVEYWKASVAMPGKVLFLKYEELKREPKAQLKRLAEFMGCGFSEEEEREGAVEKILNMCSLESLRGLEVNQNTQTAFWEAGFDNKAFFRKGEIGDWVNHMTPAMVEQFEKVTREKFQGTGLTFE